MTFSKIMRFFSENISIRINESIKLIFWFFITY